MEKKDSLSMNQLVDKFCNFSLARSYCEDMGNFILSISSKYGVDARTAIPSVALCCLCLCLWIYVSNRRTRLKPTSPDPTGSKPLLTHTRSRYIGEIHGGQLVLQRLKEDFNKAQVNQAILAKAEKLLPALLEQEHLDLKELQHTVEKLEMSGSEDSAVKILEQAVKRANDEKKPHEAYEIEMLLVQMLIFKGELENALKCKCLQDESLKDARRPLYKAIIHKMKGETEKAGECWDEFVEVQDPPVFVESETEFKKFEEIVGKLQSAIYKGVCREKSE